MEKWWCVLIVLFLAVAALPAAQAAPQPWGCCVPDAPGDCFDGSINNYAGTETEWRATCMAAMVDTSMTPATFLQSHLLGEGSATTCTPFKSAGQVCEAGCCCNDADSPKTGERTTRDSCRLLNLQDPTNNPRSFKSLEAGKTCDQTCGGVTVTPPLTTGFPVSGRVIRRGTTTPLTGVSVSLGYAGNGANQAATNAQGAFTMPQPVPAGTQVFVAVPGTSTTPNTCRMTSVTRTMTGAVTDLTIDMDCNPSACANQPPRIDNMAQNAGTTTASFTVTITDLCGTFRDYRVRRCEITATNTLTNCIDFPFRTDPAFTDPNVPDGKRLLYNVTLYFTGGTPTTTSASRELSSGSTFCMTRTTGSPAEWCGTSSTGMPARLSCDSTNRLRAQECSGGTVCIENGGTTTCAAAAPCDRCNGLLGMFAKLPLTVTFGSSTVACTSLSGTTYQGPQACYKDNAVRADGKPSLVPAYNSCLGVTDCSMYASLSACAQNPCRVLTRDGSPDSCSWLNVSAELGKGVCTSERSPSCSKCSTLFGTCTRELCQAISSDCYYDELENGLNPELYGGLPRCVAKQDMGCRYYDTQQDCTGGRGATFNAQTNALTTQSIDRLGLGVCAGWIPTAEGGHCIKNADHSPNAREDDRREPTLALFTSNPRCVEDIRPPVTTFTRNANGEYSQAELNILPLTATDDTTPQQEIKTYVCFTPNCYPNMQLGAITPPGNGTYIMRYFSADKYGNLEVVKTASITVTESTAPTLIRVDVTSS